MNTNNWISVNDELPQHGAIVMIVFGPNRTISLARYYQPEEGKALSCAPLPSTSSTPIRHSWVDAWRGTDCYLPDYWQPLPAPPAPPDPFDEWWAQLPVCLNGHGMRYLQGCGVKQEAAKEVWEAAAAAGTRK